MKNNFRYCAFFDVDETLINTKSMFSFLKFFCVEKYKYFPVFGYFKYFKLKFRIFFHKKTRKNREFLNRYYYQFYKGTKEEVMRDISKKWFLRALENEQFFNPSVLKELKRHQKNQAEIVFVSGSFAHCLEPIAEYLGVLRILATNLEIVENTLTGNILGEPVIGEGKVEAIKKYLNSENIQLQNCYAYGDHVSDLPMLNLVGNPAVISRSKDVVSYAKKNGWVIIY